MSGDSPSNLTFAERWRRSQDEVSRLRADNLRADNPRADNPRADTMSQPATPEDAAPPARCPACRSQDVKTTSKVASADAYWRCGECGEVWNVGRHRAGSRYARDVPFRR